MKVFYKHYNNGTVAIVSEETYKKINAHRELDPEAQRVQQYPGPIFTFVRPEEYATDRYSQFVTGDYNLMSRLLEGHVTFQATFYVPFSNHLELQGIEEAEEERRFRTTLAEAIEAFGLLPVEEPPVW